jgi:hypothetical protein
MATVEVPEIVPVAVSNVRPAGRAPVIEKTVLTAPDAVTAIVIGVIALPTAPLVVETDGVNADGVIIVVTEDVAEPDPAALVATTEMVYSVPGVSPFTFTAEPIALASGDAVPIAPETTGETVTV